MAFKDYLTTEGERLLAKAAAGVKVNFTKMVAGSGYMPTGSIERNISAVITPIMEMNVEASVTSNSLLLLVGYMDNSKISEGFYFREKGIYASDGTSEVLVLYANAKDKAEYIESSEVAIIEKKIRTVMAISSEEAAGITLTSDKYAAAPVVSDCSSIEEFTSSTLAESLIIGQSVIIEKKVYTLVADDYTKKDSYYAGGVSSIASYEEFGLAKLSDSTDSTDDASTGIAATPLAVKTAMDIAKKALAYYEKPTFSQAETRKNIASGESTPTIFGKIMKWFADLKDAAFASIANNCTTTAAGSVLDARQGKVLQDNIDTVDQKVDKLDTNLGGFNPVIDETGKITGYKTTKGGADTVFPFSSIKYASGLITGNSGVYSIDVGFKPNLIVVYNTTEIALCIYNEKEYGTETVFYCDGNKVKILPIPNSYTDKWVIRSITDTGFTYYKFLATSGERYILQYFAMAFDL